MKRFLQALILAAAVMVGSLSAPQLVHADHNRWLPALPTATEKRVLARGYGIYCLNQSAYAVPNFRAQMQTVYADEYARVGIQWVESSNGSDCDIVHQMVNGNNFPCGAGASACIYYYNDPVVVYYDSDLLYSDWKTTIGHEHGHWDGSHERYFDNGMFACDPNATYTRNSCATGVWWVTDYDLFVAWNTMVPDAPRLVNLTASSEWATVTWDQYRRDCSGQPQSVLNSTWTNLFFGGPAHPTCKNDVATRMAFGHSDCDGCPITWAGVYCGDTYNYCYSAYSAGSRSFDTFWRGCLYVHDENTALWWVPQVSAPNFWTMAGCW